MGDNDAQMFVGEFDVMRDVVSIPAGDEAFTPVGPKKPLALKIRSIYPGPRDHGSMLVASSVRNPSLFDAEPLAMHYIFDHVRGGQLVRPRPDQDGSDVVFYSPAVLDASLYVSLRFAFDDFDSERYKKWVAVFAKAAGLPVFALGMSGGLGGAALAQGILYAAQRTVNLGIDLFDARRNRGNDWYSTWKLNLSDEGLNRAKAGWLVFIADNPEPDVLGRNQLTRDGLYQINADDGTLRRRQDPSKIAILDEPYVVATLSGQEDPILKNWTRAAVSAAVADRFLAAKEAADGLVGVLEVYNDVVMARKINDIDMELQDAETNADKVKLTEDREALLKNVLDSALRRALKN